jgi:predicted nucleotidyltransferase
MQADIDKSVTRLPRSAAAMGVAGLEAFRSAARGAGFDPNRSDADFLVTFEPATRNDLSAFADLKEALEKLLGRPVDLFGARRLRQVGFHSPPGNLQRSRNRLWLSCPGETRHCSSIVARGARRAGLRHWTRRGPRSLRAGLHQNAAIRSLEGSR